MKLSTSVANAMAVAAKARELCGVVATPCCSHVAVRIRRIWLFGSTVQGKENPSDTDLLVEYVEVGERRIRRNGMCRLQKRSSCGLRFPVESFHDAVTTLRGGRKMLRFHDYMLDGTIAHPRVLIYPRNDWNGQVFPVPERIALGPDC